MYLIIVAALAGCIGNEEPEVNYTVNLTPTPPPPHVNFPVREPAEFTATVANIPVAIAPAYSVTCPYVQSNMAPRTVICML